MSGTSWLLGGGYPWPTSRDALPPGARASVVAGAEDGLALAARPGGALGLESPDGSLGRLTLPVGVAVARGQLFVLSADGSLVYHWDAERQRLRALAEIGVDGLPDGAPASAVMQPRRFRAATSIAARGRLLYVADGAAHRVQVFDWPTGALVRIHEGLGGSLDVVAGRHGVYVLDADRARVLRATAHGGALAVVASVPARRGRWTRIAVDRRERLYLRDAEPSILDCQPDRAVLDTVTMRAGRVVHCVGERIADAGAVRSLFDTPPVWSEYGPSGTAWTFAMRDELADPCGLRTPLTAHQRAIAVGDVRWVLDRERRTAEVRAGDGALRRRFGPLDADGGRTTRGAADAWSPADVVAHGACTLVLDERHQAVHALEPGSPSLRLMFARASSAGQAVRSGSEWHRIAIDDAGAVLLWDGGGDTVDRVDLHGRSLGTCTAAQARGWFARQDRPAPTVKPARDVRVGRDGRLSFAQAGGLPDLRPVYERSGTWTSDWLDSGIHACQWHLAELSMSALPPGATIAVRTRTTDEPPPGATATEPLGGSWSEPLTIVAPAQPTDEELRAARSRDLLVQSGPGQYLQLHVELAGDGLATPVVERLRLRFPYESLRQYLPAVYSSPEEQRQFLDRFLGVVGHTWDDVERTVTGFERYLDPDAVPAGAPMRWLASWLGVRLEGTWDDDRNRRLLPAARDAMPHWGTPEAMRTWLATYLQNLSGHDAGAIRRAGLPGIVEGFVERRRLLLGQDGAARLGSGEPLWGPAVERRFQLGVFDREGDVELVSVGDPALDYFQHSAHRFRVYVPSAWVRTAADEALLRRAIAAQAPAHAKWELVLVDACFRVGVQSTIGLDAVVGAPATGALACTTGDEPASRPPRDRLGYDLVLGAGHDAAAIGGPALILA